MKELVSLTPHVGVVSLNEIPDNEIVQAVHNMFKILLNFSFDSERLRPSSPGKSDDSDNDIPVIPELEEQQEEDMTSKVAIAPNVAVNRVATYRELDNDLLRQAAFLNLDNEIDLKLLTKSLSPEADLIEEDRAWDWDRLFTEVMSELTTEWEKQELESGEKTKDGD